MLSALGQNLRAEIDLSASKEELTSLNVRLGTPDQFRQQGVEYAAALGNVSLTIDKRSNGEPFVRMTTDRPINDPYLDVLIEISWASGRMLREYTFLLDPPEILAKAPVSVAAPEVRGNGTVASPTRPAPAPAPAVATAETRPTQKPAKPAKSEKPVKVADEAAPAKAPPAKAAASSDTTREVKRGDTLGKIAADYVQDGVNLDQMLVAIYSNNQDAFIADDMNRVKVGKILSIPSKEAAASVTASEAHKTVAMHTANFNAYRKKVAEGAAGGSVASAASDKSSTGKIAPKVEDKTPAQKPGGDSVVISKTELGKTDKSGKASVEDKIARDRALKEEKSRVAELEANVAKLQKLEAEKKAAADKAAASKAATDKAAADKAAADKAAADKLAADKLAADKAAADKATADKAAADKAAADIAAADKAAADKAAADKAAAEAPKTDAPAVPAVEVPAEVKVPEAVATPTPPPPPPPAVKPAPEPEPSFLAENKAMVLGIALIAALVGLFVYRSRKNKALEPIEPPSQFGSEPPSALSSVFGGVGGQSVDTRDASIGDNFSQSSVSGGDGGSAGVDPVAEAEVYMAYGREAQAEEILLEAMKSEPSRHAIHLKLLELYAARKSVRPFEEVAKDLYRQTGGSGAVWQKASAMGQTLDPGNSLYQGGGLAAAANVGSDEDFGTNTVIMQPGQLARMAAAQAATSPHFEPPTEAPPMAAPSAPQGASAPALDFDLDLGSIESADAAAPEVLDFDLDLGTGAAEQPASKAAGASQPLDIEFDLEVPSIQAPEPPPPPSFNFDMDKPAAKPAAADFSAINLDLETPSDSIPDADGNPEVATKLELAQAYEEMGDKEGMRELLQEVLAEGSAAQQELARGKLAQHGL